MTPRSQFDPAEVTQPAASTGGRDSAFGTLIVQWVFPACQACVLSDGHSFGRDPSCQTVLPGTEVSRVHARVRAAGILPLLCDLDSRNGVFVDGLRIERQQLLGPGVIVRIGEWVGIVGECREQPVAATELTEIIPGWYGGSLLIARMQLLQRVAASDLPIVVQGETGTGKEGAARAAHLWSGRRGPFVAVDCGALPEHLAESLLFGHRKGAFTGADRAGLGHLRAADGGTLFLDEVLNLGAQVQAKLLRALERREVVPVGESEPVRVDLRIVCAAQAPLGEAVAAGRFRADLMARLEGMTLPLPPLRERREDIVPLFFKFLAQHGGEGIRCEAKFIESLLLYAWPLNVRELELLARRAVANQTEGPLRRSILPERMLAPLPAPAQPHTRKPTADAASFAALVAALRAHAGNLTKAAEALGLTRARAYRLLQAQPDFDLASIRKDPNA